MFRERKRIAVVTIGGTFFMEGGTPGQIKLPPLRLANPRNRYPATIDRWNPIRPDDVIIQHHPLFNIDSAEIRAAELNKLGIKLAELSNSHEIDGIVVLSGTDKMHNVVTRMAHHLHNLNKPVIFTGAQIEAAKQGSDARKNYEYAVRAAWDFSKANLNAVLLCFGRGQRKLGGELYHPLNALKRHAERLDAFNHSFKRVVGTVKWETGVKTTALGKQMLQSTRKFRREIAKLEKQRQNAPQAPRDAWTTVTIAGKMPRTSAFIPTEFTPIREGLLEELKVSETKPLDRLQIDKKAKVVTLLGSGNGNIVRQALKKVAQAAEGKPIIITSEAGPYIDLTSYEPGREALQDGMLPSGGLIPVTAEIRAEYLAHQMQKIERYAEQHKPGSATLEEFKRKLFAALYLSGAKFRGRETKQKHEQALGIKIAKRDLLINQPIEQALELAEKLTRQTEAPTRPSDRLLRRKKAREAKYKPTTNRVTRPPHPFHT